MHEYIRQYLPAAWHSLPTTYHGKKCDAHTHLHYSKGMDISGPLAVSQKFGIQKIIGIVDSDVRAQVFDDYGDLFILAKFLRSQSLFTANSAEAGKMVDEIYSQGYSIIKFWFAPRWKDFIKQELPHASELAALRLSDARFRPIFERIEALGLHFLIHISDPDLWYAQKYQPSAYYGTKSDHLHDLEQVIAAYPKLSFQVAHFGAQPEHLANLGRWFETYPNVVVDMSSARWIGRELSRDVALSRSFIQKYEDRLLWGSDLSFGWTRDGSPEEYFLTRYQTYHALLESRVRGLPLPFPDPENPTQTMINGLDLPESTLRKIYWENAAKLFHF